MPPIYFKLKYNSVTRRIAFQEWPKWLDLAEKLHSLYGLPLDKIGVSYIDDDDDEITVSSNEELQDFYQSSLKTGDVIKLNVLDLSLARDNSTKRNIAGQDSFDIIEPGWHPIPQFALADILLPKDHLSDGPHAFVEVINSDASGIEKDLEDLELEDGHSTLQGLPKDKGKQKASTLGAASVTSLVEEEPGQKFPIHVLVHPNVSEMSPSANTKDRADFEGHVPLESTPKVAIQNVEEPESSAPATEDPPLPTFDEHKTPDPTPNLYQDLASFLTVLNNALSSHPELSEAMRNIVNHASSGEYWRTYSSSISEAAQRFSQNSEAEARRMEAEAVRKISDVVSNLPRFFLPESANQDTSRSGAPQVQTDTNRPYPFGQFGPRSDTSNLPPYGPRPFRSSRGWNHGGPWHRPPHWFPGASVPPPPPPPPPLVGSFLHANIPPPRRSMPSPPHHNSQVPPAYGPPPGSFPNTPTSQAAPPQFTTGGESGLTGAMRNDLNAPLTAEELRARVEDAKHLYRAQKDAYRQERARRREKGAREISVSLQ